MLASVPTSMELGVHGAPKASPTLPPQLPRLLSLKTLNLPQQQVDDLVNPASAVLSTPASEILGGHPLRILVAPSGFKESLGPEHVADAIEAGIRKVLDGNSVILRKLPLHDGGEGFARALVAAHGGSIVDVPVTGPTGSLVQSHLGFIGKDKKTAVLDMAAAAGLRLVPKDERDPTITTTYGVGELIREALDAGSTKIVIDGKELPKAGGGRSLAHLASICWDGVHPRLRETAVEKVQIEAVCNVKNVLCGPKGVARVYGPQKGATPEQVDMLAASLERLAQVAQSTLGEDISQTPGSGASGGLGTGLMLFGTTLRARAEAINEYFEFDQVFENQWDFVITAEGSLDFQSPNGKMTTEIARRAKKNGAQVVALAGTIGEGADGCYGAGIKAFTSILREPVTLEQAIGQTEALVKDGAEKVMRMIMVGLALGQRHH
ncbi:unnamed protein product [Alternaria alternata]